MTVTNIFAPITKSERDDAGHLLVYGKITGPDLDLDQQICDPSWLKTAVPEWFEIGNLREMHQANAVGKAIELEQDGNDWYITGKVVDQSSAMKVEEGVLTGFSIGIKSPKVIKDAAAPNGRISGGKIVETSLVDRPCNETAKLVLAKMAGGVLEHVEEFTAKADDTTDDAAEETEEVDLVAVVRDGLNRLLAGEAAELIEGGRARGAIASLLDCLNCLDWYLQVDAFEDQEETDVNTLNLSTVADLVKAATADTATEDDKAQLDALKAALGLDKTASIDTVTEATKASQERIEALEARLVKVEQMPEPGGPSRMAPAADAAKAATADRKRHEAARYRDLAKGSQTDRSLAQGYVQLAEQLEAEVASLT